MSDALLTEIRPHARHAEEVKPPLPSATYTVTDLAQLLQCSIRTIWRLTDLGKIPKPLHIGRMVRWSKLTVDRWLESGAALCTKGR